MIVQKGREWSYSNPYYGALWLATGEQSVLSPLRTSWWFVRCNYCDEVRTARGTVCFVRGKPALSMATLQGAQSL